MGKPPSDVELAETAKEKVEAEESQPGEDDLVENEGNVTDGDKETSTEEE